MALKLKIAVLQPHPSQASQSAECKNLTEIMSLSSVIIDIKNSENMDSGCDTVASDIGGRGFESSYH